MPPTHHVLLVDDYAEVRAVLAYLAARTCFDVTVVEASCGAEALLAIAQRRPDLIITDYHMPGMNGLELVRTLRAQGMQMPIVAISSEPDIADGILATGANHFLPKPYPLQELRALLRSLLSADEEAQSVGA